MKKFCSDCGHRLEPDHLFCESCGSASGLTSVKAVPTPPADPILDRARAQISQWIMPVNAIVVFLTATAGVLLDFVSPALPALVWIAGLAVTLWLVALALHVKPQMGGSMGRAGRWMASLTAPLRQRRLWFSGCLIAAFSVFAVASQQAQAQGGLVASHSKKVHSWQENLGLVQVQLAEINAEQKVGNVLLQQGNTNTSALVQGQGVQTQALGDLRDAFMAPPQRLRAALFTNDFETATKVIEEGGRLPLSEVYALGMMNTTAITFVRKNLKAVWRQPGDCAELLESRATMRSNFGTLFQPGQVDVLRQFCRDDSLKELEAALQKVDNELALARPDEGVQSCTAYYLKRQPQFRSKRDRMDRDTQEKCSFDRCSEDDSFAVASVSSEKYKAHVDRFCAGKASSREDAELRSRASALRDVLAVIGK